MKGFVDPSLKKQVIHSIVKCMEYRDKEIEMLRNALTDNEIYQCDFCNEQWGNYSQCDKCDKRSCERHDCPDIRRRYRQLHRLCVHCWFICCSSCLNNFYGSNSLKCRRCTRLFCEDCDIAYHNCCQGLS